MQFWGIMILPSALMLDACLLSRAISCHAQSNLPPLDTSYPVTVPMSLDPCQHSTGPYQLCCHRNQQPAYNIIYILIL